MTAEDMEYIPKIKISDGTTWDADSDLVDDLIAGYELIASKR
jgi:hypothetical protein